jgi:hypothetical protein
MADAIQTGSDVYDALTFGGAVAAGWQLGDWLLRPNNLDDLANWLQRLPKKISRENRAKFCPLPSAPSLPDAGATAMGARHIASDAFYIEELIRTGVIPANPRGTYFTLDEGYDALTPFRLQIPHDGAIRVEFALDQLGNDVAIPLGNWGVGPHLEPFARDFPDFGFGGAS